MRYFFMFFNFYSGKSDLPDPLMPPLEPQKSFPSHEELMQKLGDFSYSIGSESSEMPPLYPSSEEWIENCINKE